jgi:hypothetical protein
MPDEALRQRFEAVVNSAAEPLVRQYLEEAYRCFVAEAFNAAVVMIWNAVAYYLSTLSIMKLIFAMGLNTPKYGQMRSL